MTSVCFMQVTGPARFYCAAEGCQNHTTNDGEIFCEGCNSQAPEPALKNGFTKKDWQRIIRDTRAEEHRQGWHQSTDGLGNQFRTRVTSTPPSREDYSLHDELTKQFAGSSPATPVRLFEGNPPDLRGIFNRVDHDLYDRYILEQQNEMLRVDNDRLREEVKKIGSENRAFREVLLQIESLSDRIEVLVSTAGVV